MTRLGGWGIPGMGSLEETSGDREIFWGASDQQLATLFRSAVIDGTTRDAGNSPTTVLRPGLLLGIISATGQYKEWNPDGSDGSQYIQGVLWKELKATDFDANNADRAFAVIGPRAPLRAKMLLVEGTALTSSADEYLARRQLAGGFCVLDDDPFGHKAGASTRYETVTGATDTITADQNGMTLFYSNVAAVLVTLPALKAGLSFDFVRTADEELVVASAEGDNMIVGNDLSADSITITTAGQQIGARVRISSVYVGTALKWLPELPSAPFGTGLTGGFAYSIAS